MTKVPGKRVRRTRLVRTDRFVVAVEVEAVIAQVAGVREVAVIGVPDPVLGAAVKAFVVPYDGASVSSDDIRRMVRDAVGDVAVPKLVEMIAELPRTASGKVKKGEL